MQVIYSSESLPKLITKSLFLAGPTPRTKDVLSWRPEAIKILKFLEYDGVVFVPERSDNHYDYDKQIQWEYEAMKMSDCVLFWIPRELNTMPGFTTNDEWGHMKGTGKVVFGAPDSAHKTSYQKYFADAYCIPKSNTLDGTIKLALDQIGEGAYRTKGECNVPIMIWNTKAFQSWYISHKNRGNYLNNAKLLWNFRVGKDRKKVFAYTLWTDLYIKEENRFKKNEFIFSRTDISSICLFKRKKDLNNYEVVLVKEFRSPVRNNKGFVYELPGGSSFDCDDPLKVASDEVYEETGLKINPERFKRYDSKQVAATLSTHHSQLWGLELTEEEMNKAKRFCSLNKTFGNEEDSEMTYVKVVTVQDLMYGKIPVDWSTLGMIMRVVV